MSPLPGTTFLSSGVILYDESNRVLLQRRDQEANIFFPGFWGLFGGACEPGESPEDSAIREIQEELCIKLKNLDLFLHLRVEPIRLGCSYRSRYFFLSQLSEVDKACMRLNEGSEYKFFFFDNLPNFNEIVPLDFSAISLFYLKKVKPVRISPLKLDYP